MMKRIFALYIPLLIIHFSLQAQTTQKGMVRLQNSGNKAIPGVQIIFRGAPATDSDNDGIFNLVFTTKKPGDITMYKEIYKKKYELVNDKELQTIILSNDPLDFINIILAEKGSLAKMRVEYYQVSEKALTANYRKKVKALEAKLDEKRIENQRFQDERELLLKSYERQLKDLNKLVEKFVRTNFDDVSELYNKAFAHFKNGHIDSAVIVLEDANLIDRAEQRIKERERINTLLREIQDRRVQNFMGAMNDVDALQLKNEIFSLKNIEDNNNTLYQQIHLLDSINDKMLKDMVGYWIQAKQFGKILDMYDLLKTKTTDRFILASIYTIQGDVYLQAEKTDSAIVLYTQSYNTYFDAYRSKELKEVLDDMVVITKKLSNAYLKDKKQSSAIEYSEKQLEYAQILSKTEVGKVEYQASIGLSYLNLANLYVQTSKTRKAKRSYKKALKVFEKCHEQTQDKKYQLWQEAIDSELFKLK